MLTIYHQALWCLLALWNESADKLLFLWRFESEFSSRENRETQKPAFYREAVICNSSQEKQIQPYRQRPGRVRPPCHAWSIISISILEGNNMTPWVKQQVRTVALHYCSTSLIFGSYLTYFSLPHFPYHKTFRWDSGWIFMWDSLGYEDEKGVEKEQLFHS